MAAVNSSSTWQAPIKSDENQVKIGCSAVFELLSGGKLQLALNHGLCVDATGGQLHLASCEKSHALQEFSLKDELLHVGHKNHCCLDGRGDPSTLFNPFEAFRGHILHFSGVGGGSSSTYLAACGHSANVEALTTGCESIVRPEAWKT